MTKLKILIAAIVVAIVAVACSPRPDTEKVILIKNESSHEITIKGAYRSYIHYSLKPQEAAEYILESNICHYMVNFDGQITTCHTWYDKNNPHSLGVMIVNLELYEPIIDGYKHIYEFVFTDADYEYALEHPFDYWETENWEDYITQ